MCTNKKYAICKAAVQVVFTRIMHALLENEIQAVERYHTVFNQADFVKRLRENEIITNETLLTHGLSKLDVSQIYKIFKLFDLITSPTHIWGAVPSESDIEIGDDVERIWIASKDMFKSFNSRTLRKEMPDEEFQTFFNDVVQLCMRVDIHLRISKDSGFQTSFEKTIEELQYMNFPSILTESEQLSAFVNAFIRSLTFVKLQQNFIKRHTKIRKIICGVCKIPQSPCVVGSIAEGLETVGSDMDRLVFADTYKVFDGIKFIPIPEEGHLGYSKLHFSDKHEGLIEYADVKHGKLYLKNSVKELVIASTPILQFKEDLSIHGPAISTIFDDHFGMSLFHHFETTERERIPIDFVFCIRCTEWPPQASEWATRSRFSNWPTKELVAHIIQSGCFYAAVGSKESKESNIQWRASFNTAEQLLFESFNETQIHCFLLLKLFKNICLSHIAGKNITSYTIKTLMFWCIEKLSDDFWQSSNLVLCFFVCVSELKSFVEKRFLPNYFIRERNQFTISEFTSDIQTKTKQFLVNCLTDPRGDINSFLPLYRDHANIEICKLHIRSKEIFIDRWLITQVGMAYKDELNLPELYDGYNIQYNLKRCHEALEKLRTVEYTQPYIRKLQNCMGFLQYILLRGEKTTGEYKLNSDTRRKYSECMKLSAKGDLTHTTLRIATCYLDEGVKDECLNIIRTVTDLDGHFFMQTHWERLRQTLHCDIGAFRKKDHDDDEISLYNKIIYDIDFVHQNPYRTTDEFERLKEEGHVLIGCDSLSLAWNRCYFDVTFMLAELPVLPKPAALELCVDHSQKHVSFHPFLYALLLEFLWHEKYDSGNNEKVSVLEKMKNYVSQLPIEMQSRGLNFITYCCSLQKDYRSATRYLLQSLELNPVKKNVAYLNVKYILTLLRLALSDA